MTSFNAVVHSGSRDILKVWFDKAGVKSKSKELSFLRRICSEKNITLELCDADTVSSMATGTTHGGVIFECNERTIPHLSEIDFNKSTDGINGFYVMIEGIEDPYNFGYALRSLYAAGVQGVVLTPRNWMNAAGVVCRSSAGASERFNMYIAEPEEAVTIFREAGYKIFCAGIRDSVSVYDCDMTDHMLFIVGGEKRGISSNVLSMADHVVRLDYGRDFRGSLSAASAASIMAYEIFRQKRNNTGE